MPGYRRLWAEPPGFIERSSRRWGAVPPEFRRWGALPPDRLYALQQQDMARIPRLENQEPIKLRTNLPAPAEMYLWVSERNVAQKDAATCQNSRH